MTFNNGDGYEIYKLVAALDQPGRGKGDLLADQDPIATGSWPHQALEPVYAWGNTYNNSQQLDVASGYPTIQENRDYYNQKTPFDGTAGVGVGPLAVVLRPARPGLRIGRQTRANGIPPTRAPTANSTFAPRRTLGRFIISLTRIHILWWADRPG